MLWASEEPVANVDKVWSRLAAAFAETGIWPFVIDTSYGFEGFDDRLMDVPRGRHTEVLTILRRGWADNTALDAKTTRSAGRARSVRQDVSRASRIRRPGSARPPSIISSRDRPGTWASSPSTGRRDILDAVGWMGAANYDGDPLDMTTVLRSWEVRFDAYVIGMGTDTLVLAVGRPPRDLSIGDGDRGGALRLLPGQHPTRRRHDP